MNINLPQGVPSDAPIYIGNLCTTPRTVATWRAEAGERAMFRCWMDIVRQRGVAAADREMRDNLNWIAPGSQS